MMIKDPVSRRQLLSAAGATALVAGTASLPFIPKRARAQPKTLKIMQWRHFVPGFDPWFNQTFATQWGEANDTQVLIDNVGYGEISTKALAEVQAQRGHDLVQFVTPHATLYEHVIDHREVFEECSRRFGQPAQFAVRANYNPSTDRYLGFAPSFQPAVIVYRKDLWDTIGASPNSWAEVLSGGRRLKLLHDKPVGISLASEHNCEQTLRSIMYSFGSSEQDADQNPTLRSAATLLL
jgi:multiple sugar transport system substrate-binding protein